MKIYLPKHWFVANELHVRNVFLKNDAFFSWKGVKYGAPKVTLHKGINVSVYDKEFQF